MTSPNEGPPDQSDHVFRFQLPLGVEPVNEVHIVVRNDGRPTVIWTANIQPLGAIELCALAIKVILGLIAGQIKPEHQDTGRIIAPRGPFN